MEPESEAEPSGSRKRFRLYLDPIIFQAFRLLCRSQKRRLGTSRANRVLEALMLASLRNPLFLDLAFRLALKPKEPEPKEPSPFKDGKEEATRKEGKGKGGT
jgi:hypothetical protein